MRIHFWMRWADTPSVHRSRSDCLAIAASISFALALRQNEKAPKKPLSPKCCTYESSTRSNSSELLHAVSLSLSLSLSLFRPAHSTTCSPRALASGAALKAPRMVPSIYRFSATTRYGQKALAIEAIRFSLLAVAAGCAIELGY